MSLWNSLEFLHKTNNTLIISWVIFSAIFGILSWKIQSRISELNVNSEKVLNKKVDRTESKAKEFENKLVESERLRFETEKKLKQEIKNTNNKIKPPILTLASNEIKKTNKGVSLIIKFNSSKNQPLGTMDFIVQLPVGSASEITDFWPTTGGGAFQSGKDSKEISENKKTARLIYSLLGAGSPVIEIKLTKPSPIQIQGNYILKPIEIDIK